MRWRSILLFALIAVLPAAALAGPPKSLGVDVGSVIEGAAPPIDLDLVTGQAIASSLGVAGASSSHGRGSVGSEKLAAIDFFAMKGITASVTKRLEVVPEPDTAILLLLGLSGLALRRR